MSTTRFSHASTQAFDPRITLDWNDIPYQVTGCDLLPPMCQYFQKRLVIIQHLISQYLLLHKPHIKLLSKPLKVRSLISKWWYPQSITAWCLLCKGLMLTVLRMRL